MKAILILEEMPSCCNNCPCFNGVEDRSDCNLLEKEIEDILIIDKDCPLKPLGRKVEEYGLETWNTSDGIFLCEKGLFDKIYGGEEE